MQKYNLPNNRILKISQDTHGFNPREDDNLGTIVSWHSRYSLGEAQINKHYYSSAEEAIQKNSNKDDIVIPLYIYDHSGITISTNPFPCPWDSGQFGFIKISKEKIREEYSVKRISKKLIERVTQYLINEVKNYDKYLRGENYHMEVIDSITDEIEDSCGGFLGYNLLENGILDNLSLEDANSVRNQL